MRILVDVSHPAHVHLFRHAIGALQAAGHTVRVASREKDVTTDLLDAYGIEHTPLSRKSGGPGGTLAEWLGREVRLLRFARRANPDVVLSRLNPASAHVSWLLGVPNVVFHDTEAAAALARVTTPFAGVVCTPSTFGGAVTGEQIRYEGYQELAYLHPARFVRDPGVLRAHGIDPDEFYGFLRFVSPSAHHDDGGGLSVRAKRDLVESLSRRGSVYVVSEGALPPDLKPYEPPIPPAAVHQLLAHADVFAGDSGTMATEAAVLGVPAVRLDTMGGTLGNFRELDERYGLVESIRDERDVVGRVAALADDPDSGARWRRRRLDLLADKVDVTAFMVDLVESVSATPSRAN